MYRTSNDTIHKINKPHDIYTNQYMYHIDKIWLENNLIRNLERLYILNKFSNNSFFNADIILLIFWFFEGFFSVIVRFTTDKDKGLPSSLTTMPKIVGEIAFGCGWFHARFQHFMDNIERWNSFNQFTQIKVHLINILWWLDWKRSSNICKYYI